MNTWILLGALVVAVIIVGKALAIWEDRKIEREAHSS
jgi:hypothetical protein